MFVLGFGFAEFEYLKKWNLNLRYLAIEVVISSYVGSIKHDRCQKRPLPFFWIDEGGARNSTCYDYHTPTRKFKIHFNKIHKAIPWGKVINIFIASADTFVSIWYLWNFSKIESCQTHCILLATQEKVRLQSTKLHAKPKQEEFHSKLKAMVQR